MLFLLTIVGGAYLLTHVVVDRLQQRFLFRSGLEYILLGVVLGPAVVTEVHPFSDLTALGPVFAFVAGWVGLLYGLELHRDFDGAGKALRLALTDAVVTGGLVTLCRLPILSVRPRHGCPQRGRLVALRGSPWLHRSGRIEQCGGLAELPLRQHRNPLATHASANRKIGRRHRHLSVWSADGAAPPSRRPPLDRHAQRLDPPDRRPRGCAWAALLLLHRQRRRREHGVSRHGGDPAVSPQVRPSFSRSQPLR